MYPNEIINGEDHNNDFDIAEKFAKEINLKHQEVKITPKIIADEWDDTINFIEEPRYNWNLPMYYYTNKCLSNDNIVVTMAGDIGDEIYGGYTQYYNLKKLSNKPKNWKEFLSIWINKFAAPIELNIKFDKNDLLDVLLQVLPEELWNSDDIANTAMALDCITNVSEIFQEMIGLDSFSMEGDSISLKRIYAICLSINSDYKIGRLSKQTKLPIKISYKNKLPNYIIDKNKQAGLFQLLNS